MTTPIYKSGTTVPVTAPLPLSGSTPMTPTAVSVAVHDETGAVLTEITPSLPSAGEGVITFDIAPDVNLLPANARKGARQVEISFITASGTYIETMHYLLESKHQLAPLQNTFQTYPEALMVRSDLPDLTGWDLASDSSRIGALMLAHQAMCNMRFRYRVGAQGAQRRLNDFPGTTHDQAGRTYAMVSDIRSVLAWEWAEMPDDFKTALKRAQIVEADVLLSGDPIGDKRRNGIISETIGDSSMFLKQIPEVRMAVSPRALRHLEGYIVHGVGLTRA